MTSSDADTRALLARAYAAFNERRISDALALMAPDVVWPNGMEGGVVRGHSGVRDYWTRQWTTIDPHVEPVEIAPLPDGRWGVDVHQIVRDVQGTLLVDQLIRHVYTLRDGRISKMEIQSADVDST